MILFFLLLFTLDALCQIRLTTVPNHIIQALEMSEQFLMMQFQINVYSALLFFKNMLKCILFSINGKYQLLFGKFVDNIISGSCM